MFFSFITTSKKTSSCESAPVLLHMFLLSSLSFALFLFTVYNDYQPAQLSTFFHPLCLVRHYHRGTVWKLAAVPEWQRLVNYLKIGF